MISLSIVTYNNELTILKTLDSIISHIPDSIHVDIILVDNHSVDSTIQILESYVNSSSNITLIKNDNNIGYGKGHNCVIKQLNSKYHIFCNPDILIDSDIFTPLTAFMEQNSDVGLIGPRIFSPDGSIQWLNRRYPTFLDLFLRRFSPSWCRHLFQKRLDQYEMRDLDQNKISEVPCLSGAFMGCRTDILKKVGGFDKRYFLYFEDYDLGRMFQQYNYKTVYFPDISVTHQWARASHKNLKMTLFHISSAIKYFHKWGWGFLGLTCRKTKEGIDFRRDYS